MSLQEAFDPKLPPLVVICGPTAAGKTGIALEIARRIPIRLISADSVQVYRGMDIGTAKPDARTLAKYPHALIDIRDPEEGYSAADFVRDADAEIASARTAGVLPVVVGGTALYLRALRYGLDRMPSANVELRQRIVDEAAASAPAIHSEFNGRWRLAWRAAGPPVHFTGVPVPIVWPTACCW